ncbi:MAG: phosphonate ABC transporter ATP-binding protein [Rubrivivax sp.]|nr:phosphonate ABC transporter ATP-binding protein [Rubrivivax sp.]
MSDTVIEISRLTKTFGAAAALKGVSLRVQRGEMVALLGASGSGKSTLMRHINGLHRADAGTPSVVTVLGRTLQAGGQLAADVREQRARIATIFQQFNLVDRLPVMTNVLAGALHRIAPWRGLLRRFPGAESQRAYAALCDVGMERCAWQRASTLSGGQQQRAAIARALVQGAEILLADEPIASLDPESSRRVMELLEQLNRTRGVTVLVSLHQVEHALRHCPRTIALRDGQIVFDGPSSALTPARLTQLYGGEQLDAPTPAAAPEHRSPVPALQAA